MAEEAKKALGRLRLRGRRAVQGIERAIQQLAPQDLAVLRAWFAEYDADVWDKEFEEDVAAGRCS